jgi:uncharacterized low-complexity protein
MISPKTTALIAALIAAVSLVGAVTPAAFAQNSVDATQSNSFTVDVAQAQEASTGEQEQGFCLQANQQNAAAGNDASNSASNTISASDRSEVDC